MRRPANRKNGVFKETGGLASTVPFWRSLGPDAGTLASLEYSRLHLAYLLLRQQRCRPAR